MLEFIMRKSGEVTNHEFSNFFTLLEQGLLPLEYRSFENQKALLKNDAYNILFCKQDEKILGALAFWYVEDFVFVEHFVVSPDCRNQGIGTKMLSFLENEIGCLTILEVELPHSHVNLRRIEFYKRNGFFYNLFEYFQPPLNVGDEPLELKIMSKPKELNEKEFQKIRQRLINAVYKVK